MVLEVVDKTAAGEWLELKGLAERDYMSDKQRLVGVEVVLVYTRLELLEFEEGPAAVNSEELIVPVDEDCKFGKVW